MTSSSVRHTRVEGARVAADQKRPIQVRHYGGSLQRVHLLVGYPLLLSLVGFPRIDRYPELRELELRQLARVLLSSKSGPTLGLLRAKVRSYAHGEFPHAEHVLPALYELMESDESVEKTPLPVAAPLNNEAMGGDWEGLKRALTSSLTSGTFLDSQFYTAVSKSSTGLPKVRPIYFCSTVAGSFVSKLVARKSPTRVTCGWVTDPTFQIRRKSEHGENHFLDVWMGMTAILMTKILARRAPRRATLVQSCLLILPNSPPRTQFPPSSVRENPAAADLPIESALLLKSGGART